ncbi:hypothetical protein ACETIH_21835 [Microvirga arabica]|uniref:Uncharacterized protein n=1 Tax=Microvirga arabica TaxID=1128671 RepID=A0ABV6YDD2_9HYPH
MGTQRLFIIAPSLARLIRQETGGERVIEGYFPDQPHRRTYVQVEETRGSLFLEDAGETAHEERAELPLAHAQVLLAVSQGQVEHVRTRLSIGSHEIQVFHVVRPGAFDLMAIAKAPEDGREVPPLPWFGPEVNPDPGY